MIVDTLNGLDVAKAAAEVVLLEENATISGDLQFTGTVNGIIKVTSVDKLELKRIIGTSEIFRCLDFSFLFYVRFNEYAFILNILSTS